MKNTGFLLLFLASVFTVSAQKVVNDPNAELRSVSGFKGIQVSGAFEVFLSQGNTEAVAVSAREKSDVAHIKTTVENGILKIWSDQKISWIGKDKKMKAYISVKDLESIKAGGSSVIHVDGILSSANLTIHLSGASDLRGTLNISEKLVTNLSGASDMNLKGNARVLKLDVSGASKIKAYDLKLLQCETTASGASSIQLHVDQELTAHLSGASKLTYQGNAVIRDIRTSGASSVVKKS